ncbi:MAG: DUF4177 domain-containing protein [Pseudomonadota bacterium]
MAVEYKCVGAPERPKRKRGLKTRSDRVAGAMQDIIEAEAVDGWEYLRTDLVPVEEKAGLFGRPREVHRAVMVFHRGHAKTEMQPAVVPAAAAPAPERTLDAPRLDDAPGTAPDDRYRLAADTSEPDSPPEAPSPRAQRVTPAGLG